MTELPMVVVVVVEVQLLLRQSPEVLQLAESNYSTKQCSDDLDAYHLITNRPHTQLRFNASKRRYMHTDRSIDLFILESRESLFKTIHSVNEKKDKISLIFIIKE